MMMQGKACYFAFKEGWYLVMQNPVEVWFLDQTNKICSDPFQRDCILFSYRRSKLQPDSCIFKLITKSTIGEIKNVCPMHCNELNATSIIQYIGQSTWSVLGQDTKLV